MYRTSTLCFAEHPSQPFTFNQRAPQCTESSDFGLKELETGKYFDPLEGNKLCDVPPLFTESLQEQYFYRAHHRREHPHT